MLETDYKIKYTVYCVTNKLNGKKYIGKHQTKDLNDSYMGSGKILIQAQKKYGLENFEREILFVFDTEEEMNAKERELVTEEFCLREDTYNICVGGQGGFSYINRNGLQNPKAGQAGHGLENISAASKRISERKRSDPVYKNNINRKISTSLKRYYEKQESFFKGRSHTNETKMLISEKNKLNSAGESNSQYGSIWITNGFENIKIKCKEIPAGYWRGRTSNR